jgi:hypothetical protein
MLYYSQLKTYGKLKHQTQAVIAKSTQRTAGKTGPKKVNP